MPDRVRWYFDFISPYAYLQSTELNQFGDAGNIECVPVLFAGLLKHWDNIGPAEVAPKRDWTFKRIAYLAHRQKIPLTLPDYHPFNPLPLLRLSIAAGNDLQTVQRLFRYVWAEGKLPQGEAFTALLNELSIEPARLQSQQVKDTLHSNGKTAASKGVFGVPSIEIDNEIFWGHDATAMAIDYRDQNDWPAQQLHKASTLASGPARKIKVAAPTQTRIPLLPLNLDKPADLISAIKQRRGGQLTELDRLLLYSEPLASGWNAFIGNVRERFAIPQLLRELAMCTVATVNHAEYEFTHHAPIYIACGGTQEKVDALRDLAGLHKNTYLFSEQERLTILLSEQMTRDIRISDNLFDSCTQQFSETELVELIATISAYNMVSRFLVALNLH